MGIENWELIIGQMLWLAPRLFSLTNLCFTFQAMPFSHYVPKPPVSDYIELLWIYEGYSARHAKERLLPTGSMELIFGLDEDQRVSSSVIGAQTQFTILDTSRPFSVIGVHFKPGGGFPFFGVPAGELQGMGVPLDLVWGGFAGEVRDRLLEAKTHGDKYRILENALLEQAHGRLGKHPAVRYALDALERPEAPSSVAAVTDQIGLSARRFIEVFRTEVGLTPKLYCRIRVFRTLSRRSTDFASPISPTWRSLAVTSIRRISSMTSARFPGSVLQHI